MRCNKLSQRTTVANRKTQMEMHTKMHIASRFAHAHFAPLIVLGACRRLLAVSVGRGLAHRPHPPQFAAHAKKRAKNFSKAEFGAAKGRRRPGIVRSAPWLVFVVVVVVCLVLHFPMMGFDVGKVAVVALAVLGYLSGIVADIICLVLCVCWFGSLDKLLKFIFQMRILDVLCLFYVIVKDVGKTWPKI